RRLAPTKRPRARLLLPGGEELDEVELLEEPSHHLLERRGPVAKLGCFRGIELGELGLELQVDPARAVLDGEERLRRQRLQLGRELAWPVGEQVPRVDMGTDRLHLG